MKRVPIFPCIAGLHAALAAAALLWALQARFGDPLTAALSPAWDSPWEQGKAAFFPLLAAGPVIWHLAGGGSRSGLCAMAMAGGGAATVLALAGAAPAIAAGGAMAAAVALYGGVLRRLKERGGWFAAAIALAAAYILLTIVRPGGALFTPRGDVSALAGIPF